MVIHSRFKTNQLSSQTYWDVVMGSRKVLPFEDGIDKGSLTYS